jgi:hypothetical protein
MNKSPNSKKCNLCGAFFKPSLQLPFSCTCAKCSDADPENTFYDEEDEFEIRQVMSVGGRVPAVFDRGDDSFGF